MSNGETISREPHESKLYSQLSRYYEPIFEGVFRRRIADTIRSLNIPAGARVLELGVGTGISLAAYPSHAEVVAIDLSPSMLAQAERKVAASNWSHVTLRQMDATKLELESQSFDYVMAFHLVTVVPEPEKLLREMTRVCKPAGTLAIINHFRSPRRWIASLVDLANPLTLRLGWRTTLGLREFLDAATLHIREVYKSSRWSLFTIVIAEPAADADHGFKPNFANRSVASDH